MPPSIQVFESVWLCGVALDGHFLLVVYKVRSSTNHTKSSASVNKNLFVPFTVR